MSRVLLLALLTLPGFARAACPDGTYTVVGQPLLSTPAAVATDGITITGGTVAIASGCPATDATIRSTRRGTLIVATWPQCGDAVRVRLRAIVDESCETLRGRFATRKPRSFRRFVAEQPCDPSALDCGRCATNASCADGAYCAKPVGACVQRGTCEPRPDACTREHVPVCGCDGVTYANRCAAAASGVNVAHPGTCDRERCGGIAGIPCGDGEFCDLPAGECHGADLQGECAIVPDMCTANHRPVCGCDGTTYPNDCGRRRAQVQKAHDGPC